MDPKSVSDDGLIRRRRGKEVCHLHENAEECVLHVAKGIALGFFGVVIPFSIKNRKISNLRRGAAIASLLGTFRAVVCVLWRFIKKFERDPDDTKSNIAAFLKRYITGIAGGLSVIPVMIIDKSFLLNSTMVFWLLVRALRSIVPSIPFGPVIIMCLSAGQILSTWVKKPSQLSVSYFRFLNSQGAKPQSVMKNFVIEPPVATLCPYIHPGMGCTTHAVHFFIAGLRRALPVYIPLHLLGFYFSRRKDVKLALVNLARSCSFLSLYCTLAWASACVMLRISPGATRPKLFICTLVSGLACILERSGRQKELAAYCLTHMFDTMYLYLKEHNYVTPKDWIGGTTLILSLFVIMQNYHHQPEFISRTMFGIGLRTSIHSPSTDDLQALED